MKILSVLFVAFLCLFAYTESKMAAYRIIAQHSRKCIDVWQGKIKNGQNLIQWDCHNGNNQRFKVTFTF